MKFQPSPYSYGAPESYGESDYSLASRCASGWESYTPHCIAYNKLLREDPAAAEAAAQQAPVSQMPARTSGRPPGGGDDYKQPLTQQTWFWPVAITGVMAVLGGIIYFSPEGTNLPLIGKR